MGSSRRSERHAQPNSPADAQLKAKRKPPTLAGGSRSRVVGLSALGALHSGDDICRRDMVEILARGRQVSMPEAALDDAYPDALVL